VPESSMLTKLNVLRAARSFNHGGGRQSRTTP
jgi:hypothetical protein